MVKKVAVLGDIGINAELLVCIFLLTCKGANIVWLKILCRCSSSSVCLLLLKGMV